MSSFKTVHLYICWSTRTPLLKNGKPLKESGVRSCFTTKYRSIECVMFSGKRKKGGNDNNK